MNSLAMDDGDDEETQLEEGASGGSVPSGVPHEDEY